MKNKLINSTASAHCPGSRFIRITTVLGALLAFSTFARSADVKENDPDGKLKARFATDDQKRKAGPYEEFYPNGKIKLRGQYTLGKKSGLWVSYDGKSGRIAESASYRNDQLDGAYVWNFASGRPGVKATYHAGMLVGPLQVLDESGQVTRRITYPRSLDAIEKMVMSNYYAELPPTKYTVEPQTRAPYKAGTFSPETLESGLNLMKLYRFLSGAPYQDLKIDPAFCEKAAHGAVLSAKFGGGMMMDMRREKPKDMDSGFYSIATAANKDANTFGGGDSPAAAVRGFMTDADRDDAAMLAHRQSMLNPALQHIGFGGAGDYVSMIVQDAARPAKADYAFIAYPGEGFYPRVLFDAKTAWSIHLNSAKAKIAKPESIKVTVQKLDEHFQPAGDPIETTDITTPAAKPATIGWTVLSFKPAIATNDVSRYWITVEGIQNTAGADVPFGYLVDFVDVPLPQKIAKGPATAPAKPTAETLAAAHLKLAQSMVGKTVGDLQFSGRRATLILQESDDSKTWKIDDPGETTVIKVTTDPSGKIVLADVDGQIAK